MILFASVLGLILSGCGTPVRYPRNADGSVMTNAAPLGRWHTVAIRPRNKHPISTWQKFNPVWWYGNLDDPNPPDWFRPGEKNRVAKWRGRNPFHNFTFYVIGIADKHHFRSGRFPRSIRDPVDGGWNFSATRYKFIWLPFFAYNRGKFDFYFGWRPGGNFGGKINYNATRPPKTVKPTLNEPAQ
jgi:hypothetical protein